MVAKHAGFGVGGYEDGADVFDAGGIGGHEFFPKRTPPGLQIYAIDPGRQLARLVDVERISVRAPSDGLLAKAEPGDQTCLTAIDGVQVVALVGTNGGNG